MSFFHNLTTNSKVINLKHLKSLIDIAHYGNDDPIVCLGSCSANVCPHTFGKESIFPIEFKIQSW